MSKVILLHGGSSARRSAIGDAVRNRVLDSEGFPVRVRTSSQAAEAAKCLADPSTVALLLLDAPHDAVAVRAAAAQVGVGRHVYDLEPRDDADVAVSVVRSALYDIESGA